MKEKLGKYSYSVITFRAFTNIGAVDKPYNCKLVK